MAFLSYSFEAKSIQSFITAGGRLRHMVGASALVDLLTTPPCDAPEAGSAGLLARAISAAGFPAKPSFTRCAGGAFSFVVEDVAQARAALAKFQALWTLGFQRAAPGLAFVDAAGAGDTPSLALQDGRGAMEGRRSFPSHRLPLATPLMARAPRTGEAAAAAGKKDLLDESLACKERYVESGRLTQIFVAGSNPRDWPLDLDGDFPFPGEDRTVAVLHADGNRMGEIVRAVSAMVAAGRPHDFAPRLLEFSNAIRSATQAAAAQASDVLQKARMKQQVEEERAARSRLGSRAKQYPARPIILGGDDLSIILRADIALEFAVEFLRAFEAQAKTHLAPFVETLVSTPDLTACAGLVYLRYNQPFRHAHDMAESLCKAAKTAAKFGVLDDESVPATLAFHRVSGSRFEDWSQVVENELSVATGDGTPGRRVLTMQPYQVSGDARGDLASLAGLRKLVAVLRDRDFPRGSLREIGSIAYERPAVAAARWERLLAVMAPPLRARFKEAYDSVAPRKAARFENPFGGLNPLVDAMALMQIERRAE